MPIRPRRLTDTDRADWAFVARGVAPLPGRTSVPGTPAESDPAAAMVPERPVAVSVLPRPLPQPSARHRPASVEIGAEPAGLDRSSWQRFRGGKVVAARRLDLHGMTTHRAFHALSAFLRTAHADRLRCVEVITGRGSPDPMGMGMATGTIRREFPLWLNLPDIRPMILAASYPHAANPGSVRILLRRPR